MWLFMIEFLTLSFSEVSILVKEGVFEENLLLWLCEDDVVFIVAAYLHILDFVWFSFRKNFQVLFQ